MDRNKNLRLALPSSGNLYEPSLNFLKASGLNVSRINSRRYTATIPSMKNVEVIFQRVSDITRTIEDGRADLGIVGKDMFYEYRLDATNCEVQIEGLGYAHSNMVLGVPDSWIDVVSITDLSDVASEFRNEGQELRVATKYPRLTERFLLKNGVNYFSLVFSRGSLEVAPAMGSADVIADITETGVTMRENRIKTITGGTIISSQAILICNRGVLNPGDEKQALTKSITELMESYLKSKGSYAVTANIKGKSADEVAQRVLSNVTISGLRGPTISKVFSKSKDDWFAVTVVVDQNELLKVVASFRALDGDSVTVSQPDYVFTSQTDIPN